MSGEPVGHYYLATFLSSFNVYYKTRWISNLRNFNLS